MDKGRSGGHSAKPTKAPHHPGRCAHPGAKVTTQTATKNDPTRKGGNRKKGADRSRRHSAPITLYLH